MKGDLDGHDITEGKVGFSLAVFISLAVKLFLSQRFNNLVEIVHRAEKFF
jgi:hypothetical protein